MALVRLYNSKECTTERGLATSRSTYDANLFTWGDRERESAQYIGGP